MVATFTFVWSVFATPAFVTHPSNCIIDPIVINAVPDPVV